MASPSFVAQPTRRSRTDRARRPRARAGADGWVLLLSAYTGVAHLVLAASHRADGALLVAAFLVAGLVQFAVGAGVVRRWRRCPPVVAALVHAGLVAAFVASRTVGLPGGLDVRHVGRVDAVGDLLVVLCEAVLVVLLVVRVPERHRRRLVDLLGLLGVVLWLLHSGTW